MHTPTYPPNDQWHPFACSELDFYVLILAQITADTGDCENMLNMISQI